MWAIEERGFKYGIVKTRIRDRKWTKWGELPESMLEYIVGDTEQSKDTDPPADQAQCPYAEPTKNLKKGAKGEGVKWIQLMLVACGYSVGKHGIDGDFGRDTRTAVRKFQQENGLEVDGIVGPLTRQALKEVLG